MWGFFRYLVKCATSSGLLGELGKEKEGTAGKEEKSLSNGAERGGREAGDVLVNNACIGDSV